jgi:zinc transport system substrate-binding protein
MLKKIMGFFIIVLALVALVLIVLKKQSLQNQADKTLQENGKINISASIYPLAYFVQEVAGDKVNVQTITPAGVEPHEYEPSPSDIIQLESSQAFIYNGAGIDVWADRVAPGLLSKRIHILKMMDHVNGNLKDSNDGHIWLDPILAKRQIENILQLLTALDPVHKAEYESNATRAIAKMVELDQAYQTGLAKCSVKEIVSSHNAFNYLARRYGFGVESIAGFSPEDDVSPARLSQLTHLLREKHIQVVFFESLVSPKLSEVLANEASIQTDILDPIEGLTSDAQKAGKNYDILMRENLTALKKAMLCQ